jgi:hypothetical protein
MTNNPDKVKWFTPINPTSQEAEMGRIVLQGKPMQNVSKTPSQSIS